MEDSDRPDWRRRRGYHHGNLRQVLLDAARQLIEQRGPVGFTLSEAARLAGVSPAAPYRHFRDREALLSEVARSGFEVFAARLEAAWDDGRPSPLAAFTNLGRGYLRFAREEPASYAAMFEASLSGLSGEDTAALRAAADRAFAVLLRACRVLCQMLPEERRPPPALVALHAWALSHGVASLYGEDRAGRGRAPLMPEEILESAVLVYLRGLGLVPDDAPGR